MCFRPFSDGNAYATFEQHVDKICREIDALEHDYVLKCPPTDLEDHFVENVRIAPLVLHTDGRYIEEQRAVQIDVTHDSRRAVFPGQRAVVPGTHLEIAIPFEGDALLWRVRPSKHSISGHPKVQVRDGTIVLQFEFPDDTAKSSDLRAKVEKEIQSLAAAVENQRHDVDLHNENAPVKIRSRIEAKREKANASTEAIASLGIPIKRRDQPLAYAVQARRRKKPVRRPQVATRPYEPEPELPEDEYQHILDVLQSMCLVIERSPETFTGLDEEGIRTHCLIQLNGHYEGAATGETFNGAGKTDILIRQEDRNVFIGECKFWRGPKSFDEAIDQLFGYLTWRDCKCALLVFNQNKDTSSVANKMHEIMEGRKEYLRTAQHGHQGRSRYVMAKQTDPGREIIITTMIFDVPTEA